MGSWGQHLTVLAGGLVSIPRSFLNSMCRRQQSASGIPRELERWVDLIRRGIAGGSWAEGQPCQGSGPPSSPLPCPGSICFPVTLWAHSLVRSSPSSLPVLPLREAAGRHCRQQAQPEKDHEVPSALVSQGAHLRLLILNVPNGGSFPRILQFVKKI